MSFVGSILNAMIPSLKWMGFSNSVNKFSEIMLTQLDLTLEGRNMAKFQEDFKDQ